MPCDSNWWCSARGELHCRLTGQVLATGSVGRGHNFTTLDSSAPARAALAGYLLFRQSRRGPLTDGNELRQHKGCGSLSQGDRILRNGLNAAIEVILPVRGVKP